MGTRLASARVVALAVLGAALIAAPIVFGMFGRAPQGAHMIRDFAPLMTQQRLAGFQADIAQIDAAVRELDPVARARPGLAPPAYHELSAQWPEIHSSMGSLLDQVVASRQGYDAVASLPDFRLFPWFFAGPGALVLLLAAVAWIRRRDDGWLRVPVAAIGVLLIAAPFAWGMFEKAPQGARMMGAFTSIETTANVARMQGYFSTMATGQGAIRLTMAPELSRAGVAHPAADRLDANWIHVLNDMTPMIGAMSDNVDNYRAVSSLPSFALFPWFFLLPGLLLLALALLPRKARP